MTNPEVVADVRYPWTIPGSTALFSGHNGCVFYFCKGDHKRVRAVAVFHRSDEPWKLIQNLLRSDLDVFVKRYEHRAVHLSPFMNFIVFLT